MGAGWAEPGPGGSCRENEPGCIFSLGSDARSPGAPTRGCHERDLGGPQLPG